ncbi:hypothetical protein J2X48_005225 [Bosea sp. BE271]|nr:hypothetical protein [Bosea robiniae]MDR6898252.1 hypothetical protein [Bosea sp. BE109]MDR7141649.1 hypothetical protein [Bosea sp. BE168]MDR7178272.1 hypothetical protein [Bosea sp. BE271]
MQHINLTYFVDFCQIALKRSPLIALKASPP